MELLFSSFSFSFPFSSSSSSSLFSSSSSDLVFTLFVLLPLWFFLPFLKYIFPEAPPPWLLGSAVPCRGWVGAGCNRLCPARGSPGLSSQRLPCSPPAASAWAPAPSTRTDSGTFCPALWEQEMFFKYSNPSQESAIAPRLKEEDMSTVIRGNREYC